SKISISISDFVILNERNSNLKIERSYRENELNKNLLIVVSFIIPFFRSFCPTTKFRLLSNAFGQMFVTSPNSSTFFWWIWSESETHWRPFHSAYF
ncbi:unnamed protein product, partial [Citrullus colocynthis]